MYISLMRRRRLEFDDTIAAQTDPYTVKHTKRLGCVARVLNCSSVHDQKSPLFSDARKTARMAYANIAAGLLEGPYLSCAFVEFIVAETVTRISLSK